MQRPNRQLPANYFRHLLHGITDEMGVQSLRLLLRQAGLDQYVNPASSASSTAYASEIAALHRGLRDYYGSGARGSLNRIGQATWRRHLEETPYRPQMLALIWRLLPRAQQTLHALELAAGLVRGATGDLKVKPHGRDFLWEDRSSDLTYGQSAEEPICWLIVGLLEETLNWARSRSFEVLETSCMAVGSDACRFRVMVSDP